MTRPRCSTASSDADAEHFEAVKRLLDEAGVDYVLDPTLVRGLDYYTRTVFEFTSDVLGAQSALGGGGRYDGLVAELGGPEVPAIGWAAGIERILLALDAPVEEPALDAFIVAPESQREIAPGLGHRGAADRRRDRSRPCRPLGEGPDEAGRPLRRQPRSDPEPRTGARG